MKTNSLFLRIILGVGVLLLAAFSALPLIPPRAVSADAPSTRFSAERAMNDLAVIAKEPHAAGSDAQRRVRNYIIAQVGTLGLSAETQGSDQLSNILVRIPGTDSTGTILVTGHYDSHPPAPGAGDDGISVAAMLEAIRVLHASTSLRNDIVFLFTDGEESGWTGAIAFIRANPAAKQESVVLCFDARPGNAPLVLQQTSSGDAWLTRQMAGLPISAWAASWKRDQERNERDYDFDIFESSGFTGVVFENEATGTRYHTARDTVEAISPDLVQAYGKTMLTLTNRFGSIDLRARTSGPDLDYVTLPLVRLVAYPNWVMSVLSGLAVLSLFGFAIVAWRSKQLSPARFLLSFLGLLIGIVLLVALAQMAWKVILREYAFETYDNIGFESSAKWLSILMISAMLLMILLMSLLYHRLGGIDLLIAAPIPFLIVGLTFYFLGTIGNPFGLGWIAWSFLGYVAGLGILLFLKQPVWKVLFLLCTAFPILTIAGPYLIIATHTREETWLPILVVSTWVCLFAPQVYAVFGYSLQPDISLLPTTGSAIRFPVSVLTTRTASKGWHRDLRGANVVGKARRI